MSELDQMTKKVMAVFSDYKRRHPYLKMDRDFIPFKITEEWGECIKSYLMLTNRGRQKGLSKKEIRKEFEHELADVFGFILVFSKKEKIDLRRAMEEKWFVHLKR